MVRPAAAVESSTYMVLYMVSLTLVLDRGHLVDSVDGDVCLLLAGELEEVDAA